MPRLRPPTAGLRLMVWVIPAQTLYLGCSYTFGSPQRLQSTAFDTAKSLMSMHAWGVTFLLVGLFKLAMILTGHRGAFIGAMCAGAGLYAFWAVLFAASIKEPTTSLAAPSWPLVVVFLHAAFLLTMAESPE